MFIYNWNVTPNRDWFVRMLNSADDTGFIVELYLTAADAQAQTNRQASGKSDHYGDARPVILANDEGASYPVSTFQTEYTWHLQVSGLAGDSIKIFKVREFVELPEISAAIYRSQDLITRRAAAEINAHTHASIIYTAALGVHIPDADIGQIAQITSDNRGIDAMAQIDHMTIEGYVTEAGEAALTNTIEAIEYMELTR